MPPPPLAARVRPSSQAATAGQRRPHHGSDDGGLPDGQVARPSPSPRQGPRLASPAGEIGRNEGAVVELRVGGADAVDAGRLSRTQGLLGIEAVGGQHQPLPPENLVATGDAAGKAIANIENYA